MLAAEGENSAWPHGDKSDRSSWSTAVKQIGIRWRSRALPRSVREARVALSMLRNFLHTRESEFRVRVSETKVMMADSMTSGRSLMVVAMAVGFPQRACRWPALASEGGNEREEEGGKERRIGGRSYCYVAGLRQ